ncbi:MAG: hypothetical protein ABFD54_14970 [Armatimonadota bacterium]|nr:hypothetical protein [bacterium]
MPIVARPSFSCPDCGQANHINNGIVECAHCGWNRSGIRNTARKGAQRRRNYPTTSIDGRITKEGCVLLLPLPPSKNDESKDINALDKLKQYWEELSWHAWLAAGRPRFKQVTVQPIFYVIQERDYDNCMSTSYKGLQDGLKGKLVPDDSPQYLQLLKIKQVKVPRGEERLELVVKDLAKSRQKSEAPASASAPECENC